MFSFVLSLLLLQPGILVTLLGFCPLVKNGRGMRKLRSRSNSVVALGCATLALHGAPVAIAQQAPPQEFAQHFVVSPGEPGSCDFSYVVDVKGKAGVLSLPGGRFIFTSPHASVTLTNESEPIKTVTLGITAPFHQSTDVNGNITTFSTGRSLLGDPTTGLVLAIGRFSWTFDINGNLVRSLSGTGRLLPVCPMIE
jgi:hypothetical protein